MNRDWWTAFLLDFGVYLFCIIGVLASRWIPGFRNQRSIPLDQIGIGELVFAAIVAFVVVFGFDQEGDKKGIYVGYDRRWLTT